MLSEETSPNIWCVRAENPEEAAALRWWLARVTVPVGVSEILPPVEPPQSTTYNDFAKMRVDLAEYWRQERGVLGGQLLKIEVFTPREDPRTRMLGMACCRTGREWVIPISAIKADSTKWRLILATPASRHLFATHPHFGEWVLKASPFDECSGYQINRETLELVKV